MLVLEGSSGTRRLRRVGVEQQEARAPGCRAQDGQRDGPKAHRSPGLRRGESPHPNPKREKASVKGAESLNPTLC